MRLKVKVLKFMAGKPIAILDSTIANRINVHVGDRITLFKDEDRTMISVIDTSKGDFLKVGEIGISEEIRKELKLKDGEMIDVSLSPRPESVLFMKKKMDGQILNAQEIHDIIEDVVNNSLTEAEIAYFVSAVYKNGMNDKETQALIQAMVSTGKRLYFEGVVVDKHSIGGIAANRTTPIVVAICASAGLIMPKTSSRAITSAAGTADVIEAIANVEFSTSEIEKIVKKVGACLVWGGSLGLSPADDKLIQIERILNLDPEPQLLASVLSKKIAVGSKYVLIDIPFGKSAKVNKNRALRLKKKFEFFGKQFGLNIKCVLTNGEQPIGRGIGPLLEIRDVIKILKRDGGPKDLEDKAVFLAGQIFELCRYTRKGHGEIIARQILDSGKALRKFREIIEAQKGKIPTFQELEDKLGRFKYPVVSDVSKRIKEIDNKKINLVASIAGCPIDKGAGVYLHKKRGEKVERGDKILIIYAESEKRLKAACDMFYKLKPISF